MGRKKTVTCFAKHTDACKGCQYPDNVKCDKKLELLYECDYRNNTACSKDHCAYLGRGLCSLTKHKEYAKSLKVVAVKEIEDAK